MTIQRDPASIPPERCYRDTLEQAAMSVGPVSAGKSPIVTCREAFISRTTQKTLEQVSAEFLRCQQLDKKQGRLKSQLLTSQIFRGSGKDWQINFNNHIEDVLKSVSEPEYLATKTSYEKVLQEHRATLESLVTRTSRIGEIGAVILILKNIPPAPHWHRDFDYVYGTDVTKRVIVAATGPSTEFLLIDPHQIENSQSVAKGLDQKRIWEILIPKPGCLTVFTIANADPVTKEKLVVFPKNPSSDGVRDFWERPLEQDQPAWHRSPQFPSNTLRGVFIVDIIQTKPQSCAANSTSTESQNDGKTGSLHCFGRRTATAIAVTIVSIFLAAYITQPIGVVA